MAGFDPHIDIDVLGLILSVVVTSADTPERVGGTSVIESLAGCFSRLRKLWADSGYCGENFARTIRLLRPRLGVEIVRPTAEQKGFAVQPHRWVVERTFGWLMRHRRLARDYERSLESAEAFIYIAMIRVQIRRLA